MRTLTTPGVELIDFQPDTDHFREAVLRGLSRRPKTLPCKFLYDEEGARLFDEICELEEYYPTRTEVGILEENIDEICACCGSDCLLVELGSGSSTKTRLLLDHLRDPAAYMPIDISREQLLSTAQRLAEDYASVEILPVCADFTRPPRLPSPARRARRMVLFFPGSTIGNFEPAEAISFLGRLAALCRPQDGLLIGVDLHKPRAVLERAYNDARGVTAAFNLNLLHRINRELEGGFDVDAFRHRAIYDERQRRIEMHLVSLMRQRVGLCGREFTFHPLEHIVTEYSHKYTVDGFADAAQTVGLTIRHAWTDPREWFAVLYLTKSSGDWRSPTVESSSRI